jgi:hypothetical protein
MLFREFFEHTFQFFIEAVLHIISFILYWGMNVLNNDTKNTSNLLSVVYDILSLTNSTLVTADMILLCTQKNLYVSHDSRFLFCREKCILLLVWWHCPLTKSNLYSDSSFDAATSEHALYKLLTFQVPNLISTFRCLDHLSKESVQLQC